MTEDLGLGEQALSKAAEIGLESQLDEAESLSVDVRVDPLSLMKGEVESVTVEGEGLVMQRELRTQELTVQTGLIKVNPWKAALGEIELERPTQSAVRMVLSEADIDRAFNSHFVHNQIPHIEVEQNGQSVAVTAREISFRLPGNGRIAVHADLKHLDAETTKQIAFEATPDIAANGYRLHLKDVKYVSGEEISPKLTALILEQVSDVLDLRNFEVPSMNLRLTDLEVLAGKLILSSAAEIRAFPGNLEG
ncbi:MAG: DUF2993 domain-containing protein [Cyanobacteria bacterium P01_C01_bin.120]